MSRTRSGEQHLLKRGLECRAEQNLQHLMTNLVTRVKEYSERRMDWNLVICNISTNIFARGLMWQGPRLVLVVPCDWLERVWDGNSHNGSRRRLDHKNAP